MVINRFYEVYDFVHNILLNDEGYKKLVRLDDTIPYIMGIMKKGKT